MRFALRKDFVRSTTGIALIISFSTLIVNVISVAVAMYFGMKTIIRPELTRVETAIRADVLGLRIAQRVEQARAYASAESPQGKENALRLFREVVADLSPEIRHTLDAGILGEAEADYANQHYDDALRKYQAVF